MDPSAIGASGSGSLSSCAGSAGNDAGVDGGTRSLEFAEHAPRNSALAITSIGSDFTFDPFDMGLGRDGDLLLALRGEPTEGDLELIETRLRLPLLLVRSVHRRG